MGSNGLPLMKVLRKPVGRSAGACRLLSMVVLGWVAVLLGGCSGGGTGVAPSAAPAAPTVRFTPQDGAKDVSPTGEITAAVTGGRIAEAVLTNADGKRVEGRVAPDGATWSATEPLGYGKSYTLSVTAQGQGAPVTTQSSFTTVDPEHQTFVSMNPLDGQTVGVGQPLAFYFSSDAPPPDKKRAEEAIRVTTEPKVEGAFHWFNDREVHWRPEQYWKPGTKVTVDVGVYGRELADGVWGQQDRRATITIGDRVVLRADGASHQMQVEKNGQVLRTIPVALGKPSFPSNNGVHVVTEHHQTKVMDSSTFGLPIGQGGYRTEVKWAVRISNGGEFLHAAPWAAGDLGRRNVSHGCINMTDADAKWVFDLLKKGDVVEITNAGGPNLRSWDGFGDWQIPWEQWVQGS